MTMPEAETTQAQWVTCNRCGTRFKTRWPVNVEIGRFVRFVQAIRCVSCGAGSDHVGLGAGMDLATDRKFRNADAKASLRDRLQDWMEWGDVGLSVASLVHALTGTVALEGRPDLKSLPADPADFRRILLAMDRMPELRHDLGKAAAISPGWAVLVRRFDELEATFLEEAGPDMAHGSLERSYAIIQEIRSADKEPVATEAE